MAGFDGDSSHRIAASAHAVRTASRSVTSTSSASSRSRAARSLSCPIVPVYA